MTKISLCQWIALVLLPLCILIAFIAVLASFRNNVQRTTQSLIVPSSEQNITIDPDNILSIEATLYHIDVSQSKQVFVIDVGVSTPTNWTSGLLNTVTFSLQIGYLTQRFTKLVNRFTVQVPVFTGSIYYYPLDDYSSDIEFYYIIEDAALNQKIDKGLVEAPLLNLTLFTRNQYSWDVNILPTSKDGTNYNYHNYRVVSISAVRSQLFRLYPVFMIIAFWILTVALLNYFSTTMIWNLAPANPVLASFAVNMLFTIVTFRGTAPLAPPIGCLMDFAAFYWAILSSIVFGFFIWNPYCLVKKPAADAKK